MTTAPVAVVAPAPAVAPSPLKFVLQKDMNKTVEMLIGLARTRRTPIDLYNGNKCILHISQFGDISEVPVLTFKTPMINLIAHSALTRGPKALKAALIFARAYESAALQDTK